MQLIPHRVRWSSRRGPTRNISRIGGDRTASRSTTYELDFRPGGIWRSVMHGPDGRDYKNEVVYVEIAEAERPVYRHSRRRSFR